MAGMNSLLDSLPRRVRVVITALPSYLAIASAILTLLATQLVPLLPDHIGAQLMAYIVIGLGWISGIVATIRRLAPVPTDHRGLLPASGDSDPTEVNDTGLAQATLVSTIAMWGALAGIVLVLARIG